MSTSKKYFPPDPAIFSQKKKHLFYSILYTDLYKIFHGKTARYDVFKIKFVDISHHRQKLRRDIE